ncbi:LCP family protein [Candidatus Saccharibacteria bacterium]|nr:LCP family protein [Candidatus Saccharibacteria bacterium]
MNKDNYNARRKGASVDGFFVPSPKMSAYGQNRPQGARRRTIDPKRTGSVNPVNTDIGVFTRSLDGFRPSGQSIIQSAGQRHSSASVNMGDYTGKRRSQATSRMSNENNRSTHNIASKKTVGEKGLGIKKRASSKPEGRWRRLLKFRGTSRRRKVVHIFCVLLIMIMLIVGGIGARAFLLGRNIFKGGGSSAVLNSQDVDPSTLKGEGDGRINILLLGKGGAEQQDGPDLTDTIIVASIDPIANEAALLSIPRDLWVRSAVGNYTKINQVYYDAKHRELNSYASNQRNSSQAIESAEASGIAPMKQLVGDRMGVPIHYYAMIDFAGFKKAIDTVGGIDVDVTEDMAVRETMWFGYHYDLNVQAGRQYFDGIKALAFSRSRKTSATGDFARSDRQRAVIVGLKDKVLSTGTLANPVKINQLMSDFEGQLSTDFSVNEMLRLYDITKNISSDKIVSLSLADLVGGSMLDGLSVQIPNAGMDDYSEIQAFVRNALRDSFLKKEDAKITILNGTETPGLATNKSNELKSYGYNVIGVGDAPTKDYQTTTLIDLRAGANKYTKSYL